jgi:hypothetical protein
MMAATVFWLCLIACNFTVFFTLNLQDIYNNINEKSSSKDLMTTSNNISSFSTDFLVYFYTPRSKSMKWNLARRGFIGCRTAITKWSKHGIISLLIPGHDPPVDITIYVDICRNPGPVHSGLESNISQGQSQNSGTFMQTAVVDKITYNRSKLLDIRRQCITRANHHLLSTLKDLGLLRYRGSRGGKRKISVVISPRGRESRSAWAQSKYIQSSDFRLI